MGGGDSAAYALNERGDVVGSSATGTRWPNGYSERHAFVWRNGRIRDLGTLGGPYSWAWDVDHHGDIVGSAWGIAPNGGLYQRAAIWIDETLVDLNERVVNLGEWVLVDARAIDAKGRILANAYRHGELRLALLIPTGSR